MRVEDVCTDLCADFMCRFCVQISCAFAILMQKGMVH